MKSKKLCVYHFKCGSHALFTGPVSTKNIKIQLKLGPMTLFTHLKIISLQYFQFLVISDIQTYSQSSYSSYIEKTKFDYKLNCCHRLQLPLCSILVMCVAHMSTS